MKFIFFFQTFPIIIRILHKSQTSFALKEKIWKQKKKHFVVDNKQKLIFHFKTTFIFAKCNHLTYFNLNLNPALCNSLSYQFIIIQNAHYYWTNILFRDKKFKFFYFINILQLSKNYKNHLTSSHFVPYFKKFETQSRAFQKKSQKFLTSNTKII